MAIFVKYLSKPIKVFGLVLKWVKYWQAWRQDLTRPPSNPTLLMFTATVPPTVPQLRGVYAQIKSFFYRCQKQKFMQDFTRNQIPISCITNLSSNLWSGTCWAHALQFPTRALAWQFTIWFPGTSSVLSCRPGQAKASIQTFHFLKLSNLSTFQSRCVYICWWGGFHIEEATVATTNYKHRSPRAKSAPDQPRLSNIISH